jgi:hypothetical protein
LTPEFIDFVIVLITAFLLFLGGILVYGLFNMRYRFLKATAEILELKPLFAGDLSQSALLLCRYEFKEMLENRLIQGADQIPLSYFSPAEKSYIQMDHATGIPVLHSGNEIIRSEELIEHALLSWRSTVPVVYHPTRPHRNHLAAQELIESLATERARDAT